MGVISRICSFFLTCTLSLPQSTNPVEEEEEEDSQPVQVLLPHLPQEIIEQILYRLPVKSLLRFRCVSKSWHSLLSNPEFAKTHLSLASSIDADYTHHHRLLIASAFAVVKSCSLNSILDEHSDHDAADHVVELDYPLRGDGPLGVRVLGCCDGLMCIATKSTLLLWNPSTRKSKRLPSYNLRPGHEAVYGFGYDASTDDYKVVGIFIYERLDGTIYCKAKVYASRSDSWRGIGDFAHRDIRFKNYPGVFVNGALHWNAMETNGSIVSLDLAKETFEEVSKPNYKDPDGPLYEALYDFNGCLGVLYDYRTCADVWVMKEYGIRETWTKLVVVPYDTRSSDIRYTTPICILKNGEVLLYTNKRLIRYNPKDGTFSYPTSLIDLEYSTVHPYVESLVSVDVDADIGVNKNTKGNKDKGLW